MSEYTPVKSIEIKEHNSNTQITQSNNTKLCSKNKQVICLIATLIFGIVLIVLAIFIWLVTAPGSPPITHCNKEDRKLVIISLDGFANIYLNRNISTPNIDYYFKLNGVSAPKGLQETFPTKTYSSHYSIVTGMYPATHGIVANKFYDPVLKEYYSSSLHKADPSGKFYKGEPIWNTAKLGNISSATFYFPGSLSNCSGRYANISGYPTFHYDAYEYDWLFMDQMNKSIDFMLNGYGLILLYMYQPDFWGHVYGPNSIEVVQQIEKIDQEIGLFMDMLKANRLFDKTDIIIVSDHGMTDVEKWNANITVSDESKQIIINSTIFDFNQVEYFIIDVGLLFIYLYDYQKENISDYIYTMQLAIMNNKNKYVINENGNMPYHFNNGYHDRIPDFMVEAALGYTFYANISGTEYSNYRAIGNHGYNNSQNDMLGILFASGPSFKSGYQLQRKIESIHLYPLFCELLCVEPNPNTNGSIEFTREMLKNK